MTNENENEPEKLDLASLTSPPKSSAELIAAVPRSADRRRQG